MNWNKISELLEVFPPFTTPFDTPAKLNNAVVEFERAMTEAHSRATRTREVVHCPKRLPEELKALICVRRQLIPVVITFHAQTDAKPLSSTRQEKADDLYKLSMG
ncbi:hypothetical protein Zmor_008886 [Zophobas morio]|jgi:hypothetical protein|uniref:Uncharacterized protein n=1 Tax=Zophobas morio TaxID=2755281 RepID=A0AA38HHV7_9CUCU|nr:hypothetical protein Zmor_008886 [Zophobas morio]